MAEKNSIPQFVNSESIMSDSNYVKWLSDLKSRIRIAQLKAAIKVNEELHKLYWSLGEDICNKQKLYKWGTNFIKQLSLDLRSAFPNVEGFSWSNLYPNECFLIIGKVNHPYNKHSLEMKILSFLF